ncbi:carboxypeptidase-like regulatory domain-containing protein [Rufibacter immobilis]|uniref:carboxypeptidase-like regulatory domain-containing protein n=1 Tax=Rufibacter immobilis TaxID=1348778 RepID=UPI0035ED2B8B
MLYLLNAFASVFLLVMVGAPFTSQAASRYQHPEKELLSGKVIASGGSGQAIAYASIGILDEAVGTVSDEAGRFSLSVTAAQRTKKLRISAIGYEAQELNIEELLVSQTAQNALTITLTPAPVQLAEVKVGNRKWKNKTVGGHAGPITIFHHNFGVFQRPIEENLGRELGILINNGPKPSFLNKLNFCLTSNKYDQVKLRVKIYTFKDGKPAQNITPTNILYTVKNQKKGWLQVDLEPYGMYVDQDFAIALEWIDCAPRTQNNSLTIAASMPGFHTSFYKDASQAKWDKWSAVGMGMNVEVQQEN